MKKIGSLADLARKEAEHYELAKLPVTISMTDYAREKALAINGLVKKVHGSSYEWYGFTIADRAKPEVIVDIGIGVNDENQHAYTKIEPENIDKFKEQLPLERVINGWIHSHGDMNFRQFSGTDDANHIAVVDYVTSLLRKPIEKREVMIKDLSTLVEGSYTPEQMAAGGITLITDQPIGRAKLFDTVMGGFSYAIVVGDSGWSEQEITYKRFGLLYSKEKLTKLEKAPIEVLATGAKLTDADLAALEAEVKEKLKPRTTFFGKLAGGIVSMLGGDDEGPSDWPTMYKGQQTGPYTPGNPGTPGRQYGGRAVGKGKAGKIYDPDEPYVSADAKKMGITARIVKDLLVIMRNGKVIKTESVTNGTIIDFVWDDSIELETRNGRRKFVRFDPSKVQPGTLEQKVQGAPTTPQVEKPGQPKEPQYTYEVRGSQLIKLNSDGSVNGVADIKPGLTIARVDPNYQVVVLKRPDGMPGGYVRDERFVPPTADTAPKAAQSPVKLQNTFGIICNRVVEYGPDGRIIAGAPVPEGSKIVSSDENSVLVETSFGGKLLIPSKAFVGEINMSPAEAPMPAPAPKTESTEPKVEEPATAMGRFPVQLGNGTLLIVPGGAKVIHTGFSSVTIKDSEGKIKTLVVR